MKQCCDLHVHSDVSDGSDHPARLVELAVEAGLCGIALTDHDTVSGIPEALEAGARTGLEVIPGLELSVIAPKGNMHLLGYGVDIGSSVLGELLARVQEARARRNRHILERLRDAGCPISKEDLVGIAGHGQIGRPHFARAMVNHGCVATIGEAFSRFLGKGGRAYVPKAILHAEEAISAIHASGGVAVLAHPISLGCGSKNDLDALIGNLASMGLDGIECYYSEHTPTFTWECLALCSNYRLLPTGGSDYHGKAKPTIALGKGRGDLCVPADCLKAIQERVCVSR